MKLHIIVNPAAGHGRSLALLPRLTDRFAEAGAEYEILQTTAPMDARVMARDACIRGSGGIIGIGGDGTLQEVVAGMREAFPGESHIPTPLGILPCGSGNDFALTFTNGKKNESFDSCADNIINGKMNLLDLIRVNGNLKCQASGQVITESMCLNIANIGLDARIVQNAAALKKRFGKHAYLAAAYKSIARHKNVPLRVETDGGVIEGDFTLIAVCNGQYYGGGLRISPEARLDDGLITVCLIDGIGRLKTMVLFPSILFEKHTRLKFVRYKTCKRLTVNVRDGEVLCVDGNLYDCSGSVSFALMPAAIKLFTL